MKLDFILNSINFINSHRNHYQKFRFRFFLLILKLIMKLKKIKSFDLIINVCLIISDVPIFVIVLNFLIIVIILNFLNFNFNFIHLKKKNLDLNSFLLKINTINYNI